MDQNGRHAQRGRRPVGGTTSGFRDLLHDLLSLAHLSHSRAETLRRVCSALIEFSGCDMVSLRIDENGKTTRCRAILTEEGALRIDAEDSEHPRTTDDPLLDPVPQPILTAIVAGHFSAPTQSFTRGRSFWTGDASTPVLLHDHADKYTAGTTAIIGGRYSSLALIQMPSCAQGHGILFLGSMHRDFFSQSDILAYEGVAETVCVLLSHHSTQWALRERVKELTCLYGIESVASRAGVQIDDFLSAIVDLLPPGWQYPQITSARILLDQRVFCTPRFMSSDRKMASDIIVNNQPRGVVEVFYLEERPDADEGPFLREERNLINAVAETIGRQLAHHEAQWALRERVKELTCLFGIAKLASKPTLDLAAFLSQAIELIPQGWQYPEITEARVTVNDLSYATPGFVDGPHKQSADIFVKGVKAGQIDVVYTRQTAPFFEGPFLREERSLLDEIGRRIGLFVEQWNAEQERSKLEEQLRHADRLATIGQLTAGVAHELNEPLSVILGFAQLIRGSGSIGDQTTRDVDKIISATLHAREVIRKMMFYTRQMPVQKVRCDLSQLVRDGLYFLESRCNNEGIVMTRDLEEGLPTVMADPAQLYQVLVNLGVNAIQAMPNGGRLTISTRSASDRVCLTVSDTGTGMTEEVLGRLFTPFFTTKEAGQGTGLGLAVVQGIVMAHGGEIHVDSEPGTGSSFEVCIPIDVKDSTQ